MSVGAHRLRRVHPGGGSGNGRTLLFEDAFTGSTINTANWDVMTRPKGYRNNELQYYAPEQATVSGGNLIITAEKRGDGEWYSAELNSKSPSWFNYGLFEARMKLPMAQGIWPAFWLMGTQDGWPDCGEVDILEAVNNEGIVYNTLHGGGSNGHWQYEASTTSVSTTSWHVYGADIQPNVIDFYIDGTIVSTVHSSQKPSGANWIFGAYSNFTLLNVAVGGTWPGPPNGSTPNSVQMLVDYVRVYA